MSLLFPVFAEVGVTDMALQKVEAEKFEIGIEAENVELAINENSFTVAQVAHTVSWHSDICMSQRCQRYSYVPSKAIVCHRCYSFVTTGDTVFAVVVVSLYYEYLLIYVSCTLSNLLKHEDGEKEREVCAQHTN
uniref:Uncharacterized protein n=1 Tax=Glossina pallidipes TaxID=7398 RepID=A0A1A9Z426_GLOPL